MKKKNLRNFCIAVSLLSVFILWTIAVMNIDVQEIGPNKSSVGMAGFNSFFHGITGTNMLIYVVTDWLGLIPIFVMFAFAVFGLVQLIKRKSLFKVDADILALGVFYIIVFVAYMLFENFIVNYRPVLIDGILEASYPSSTTLLVMCVMFTAVMQFQRRIKNTKIRKTTEVVCIAFTVFMVAGRLISGVHWLSDIIGGIFLSASLTALYYFIANLKYNI